MKWLIILITGSVLLSCGTGRPAFDPRKKFDPRQLQSDYRLFRKILEERHPSLYWYTSREEMDRYFNEGLSQFTDSMTEMQFRNVLAGVIARIECGHTSVRLSKRYYKYLDTLKQKIQFPLYFKTWNDTVVLVHTIFKNDPGLVRGQLIDSLVQHPVKEILDTLRKFIPVDGGNIIALDQRLSTGNTLGMLYSSIYGWPRSLTVSYTDKNGVKRSSAIVPYRPPADTAKKQQRRPAKKKIPRHEKLQQQRTLTIDSSGRYAVMALNSFSENLRLKSFFRSAFKNLRQKGVEELIIDLRSNGGGRISNATNLMKYLAAAPFKLVDSLYAKSRKSKYSRYIKDDVYTRLFMLLVTRKRANGQYHYGLYERHYFKPFRKKHYNGRVYLLTGGNSFSATTMVAGILREQENIIIVGEPTGGTAYGNSALLIPDVTLPNTKVQFRLPLFRLVMNKNLPRDGRGVLPEIFVGPDLESIRKGIDYKMEKAKELIRSGHQKN